MPHQQPRQRLTATTRGRGWHRWCDERADARIEVALELFSGIVGDEIGASVRELRDEIITAFRERTNRSPS
jgi:hypothetical protein